MQDEYPLPDDGTAEEQRLREVEREESERALAEAQEALNAAGQKEEAEPVEPERAYDPYAAKREILGFDLAWWAEDGDHGTPPLDIASDLANHACGRAHFIRDLERFGYDASEHVGTVDLDGVSGPLVVAGLQLLGTLHSHVRDEIEVVLKRIYDAVPEMSDEQAEAYDNAATALQREQFEAVGLQFLTPEEFKQEFGGEGDEPQERFDSSAN